MKKFEDVLPYGIYQAMKLQCETVGIDIDELDYSEFMTNQDAIDGIDEDTKKVFYKMTSWTEEQEEEFREKFVDLLYKDKKIRRDFGVYFRTTKQYIRMKVFPHYNLQFGFMIKGK